MRGGRLDSLLLATGPSISFASIERTSQAKARGNLALHLRRTATYNRYIQPTREERGQEDTSGHERAGAQDVDEEHAQAGGHSLPSARLLHEEGDEPVERWGQADRQGEPRHSNGPIHQIEEREQEQKSELHHVLAAFTTVVRSERTTFVGYFGAETVQCTLNERQVSTFASLPEYHAMRSCDAMLA